MANESANPNISEIQTKNGSVYDVAAKRFSGNRTVELNGDVTANETGWDGSGKLEVSTTIAEGAVDEGKIADSAVTNAKVADGAVNWDKIASSVKNGTIAGNYTEKLATCAQVKTYVDEAITGHGSYLGQKSVAEVNALTGMNNGDHVSVSDAGSITNPDGTSTSVNAGDNVIYDGTLRKWDCLAGDYKVKQTAKEIENTDSTKTISKVTQNENGEVSVTYQTIGKVATAGTADKVNVSEATSGTWYDVVSSVGAGEQKLVKHTNIQSYIDNNNGTILLVGSFSGTGIVNRGSIDIASTNAYAHTRIGSTATTGRYVEFPDKAGTIALTSDFDSYYTKTQVDAKNDVAITDISSGDLNSLPVVHKRNAWFKYTASDASNIDNVPEASQAMYINEIKLNDSYKKQFAWNRDSNLYHWERINNNGTWTTWIKVYNETKSKYDSTSENPISGKGVAEAIGGIGYSKLGWTSIGWGGTAKEFKALSITDLSTNGWSGYKFVLEYSSEHNNLPTYSMNGKITLSIQSIGSSGEPKVAMNTLRCDGEKYMSLNPNAKLYKYYDSTKKKISLLITFACGGSVYNGFRARLSEATGMSADDYSSYCTLHSNTEKGTLPTGWIEHTENLSVRNDVYSVKSAVGSSSVPVYVSSNGEVNQCGDSLDVSISGTASKVSVGDNANSNWTQLVGVKLGDGTINKAPVKSGVDSGSCYVEFGNVTSQTNGTGLRVFKGSKSGTITSRQISDNRSYNLPDASGTIALTSDIAKKRNIIAELIDDTNDIVTIAESISGSVGVHYYYWVSAKKPTGYPPDTKYYSCLMEIINRVGYQQINCYCDAINKLWFKKYRYASNGVSNWSDWGNVYYVDPELTTNDIDALWAES